MNTKAARSCAQLDRLLAQGQWSPDVIADVACLLSIDAAQGQWPDISVVLHAANHPGIVAHLAGQTIPPLVGEALGRAMAAVAPLVGMRLLGPLAHQAERLTKRFESERRKFELVRERMAGGANAAGTDHVRMLSGYLGTDPAPMFAAMLEALDPSAFEAACQHLARRFDPLCANAQAVVALGFESEDESELAALLGPWLATLEVPGEDLASLCAMALRRAEGDAVLVAAALAVVRGYVDLVPAMLARVIGGHAWAGHLALMAGLLSPLETRHALSQMLVDASWRNPEEPEMALTVGRARALVAARCLLPLVGSPMAPIAPGELSELGLSLGLEGLVAALERGWRVMEQVTRRG